MKIQNFRPYTRRAKLVGINFEFQYPSVIYLYYVTWLTLFMIIYQNVIQLYDYFFETSTKLLEKPVGTYPKNIRRYTVLHYLHYIIVSR